MKLSSITYAISSYFSSILHVLLCFKETLPCASSILIPVGIDFINILLEILAEYLSVCLFYKGYTFSFKFVTMMNKNYFITGLYFVQ